MKERKEKNSNQLEIEENINKVSRLGIFAIFLGCFKIIIVVFFLYIIMTADSSSTKINILIDGVLINLIGATIFVTFGVFIKRAVKEKKINKNTKKHIKIILISSGIIAGLSIISRQHLSLSLFLFIYSLFVMSGVGKIDFSETSKDK
jgi:uncharacterized oligopeptide transporter (OPT) family protein